MPAAAERPRRRRDQYPSRMEPEHSTPAVDDSLQASMPRQSVQRYLAGSPESGRPRVNPSCCLHTQRGNEFQDETPCEAQLKSKSSWIADPSRHTSWLSSSHRLLLNAILDPHSGTVARAEPKPAKYPKA